MMDSSDTIIAFLHGILFDISAICYFNVLFFVMHIIPGNFKNRNEYQLSLKWLFVAVNGIILVSNIIDIEYFKFTNKRTTFDVFYLVQLGNDIWILLPRFLKDYWYLLFIWILIFIALWKFYPKILDLQKSFFEKISIIHLTYQSLLFILISSIIFIGGRGSLELKPLRIISASKYVKVSFIPLVLNTPFSILRTSGKLDIVKKNYFRDEELDRIYNPLKEASSDSLKKNNVVVIILESFSNKYIGYMNDGVGNTPFLDSLMNESLVFFNNFANGKKSIEGIPAILASLPTLMNNPYISSPFVSNQINSLSSILKTIGYSTSFFHGGTNGTMGFDKFARISEFDHYFGRTEYNNEDDYDGNWGIYDEEFLLYFANKLDQTKEPFFSTFFTLSSHHPFPIPKKYKNKFNKSGDPIINSIAYTDYALQVFFNTISKTKWYKNTLFIFTADHTAGNTDENYIPNLSTYSIPLFFYHAGNTSLKGKRFEITQQIDIMPSALDYVNYNNSYIAFGNSVFDESADRFAVSYLNQVYQIIKNDYSLKFDGEKSVGLYQIFTDTLMENNLIGLNLPVENKLETKLKALIQSYNNRLIDNKMVVKK